MNFRRVLLVLMIFSLTACSTTTKDPLAEYQGQSANQIFAQGENNLHAGHYSDAITAFEALTAMYPFSSHSEQAQIDLIYSYYKNQDSPSAVAAAARYIHLYPQGKNIDYAYYLKGLANFEPTRGIISRYIHTDQSKRDLTAQQEAYQDFYTVVYRFPDSKYAADARQRLIYLRDEFAQHELNIAYFYMQRNVYVGAANRASDIVEHYQHSTQVPDALAIMVKAYRKMGLAKRADTAYQLLAKNFPNSRFVKALKPKA